MKPHPIHLSIKNYQKSPKETKLWVNLPGNGDMSDPDETKPSMGAEEYEKNPNSCVQPNSSDGFYVWNLNPSDRTITLTKLLIKHANLPTKETGIGA